MKYFFRQGYKEQAVEIVPDRYDKQRSKWNSFSCPVTEIDLAVAQQKSIGSLNPKIEKWEIHV